MEAPQAQVQKARVLSALGVAQFLAQGAGEIASRRDSYWACSIVVLGFLRKDRVVSQTCWVCASGGSALAIDSVSKPLCMSRWAVSMDRAI